MRKGLLILGSDNVNLSLIHLYKKLCEWGFCIDCFVTQMNDLALHAFDDTYVHLIESTDNLFINDYDFIVCGRNCFNYFTPVEWIGYQGIIYTDNTAFYEGRDVYGDLVFTNGEVSKDNLAIMDYLELCAVGCLKSLPDKITDDQIWGETDKKRVLYIESGHYPFGDNNRKDLAESIAETVQENQDVVFVVKPRFLLGEAKYASHRNEDYLFYYVSEIFGMNWPSNLIWLHQYYSLNSLIMGADVIIHTYSSAHTQGVLLGKKVVNISDLLSDETADFRENRINHIKKIIDKAGNNCSRSELKYSIRHAREADRNYVKYIGGGYESPAEKICDIISNGKICGTDFTVKRLKGYFSHLICYLENRYDEYDYFYEKMFEKFSILEDNADDVKNCISYIERERNSIVLNYILEHWIDIRNNRFNRAYTMRELYYLGENKLLRKMLNESYVNEELDSAYFFYSALLYKTWGEAEQSSEYAQKYLDIVRNLKYEMLDCETKSDISLMEGIIKK